MLIGFARVCADHPNLYLQHDELKKVDYEKIINDTIPAEKLKLSTSCEKNNP